MTPAGLVLEHRQLARLVALDYYLPGHDHQDVEQEALIALWLAARAFDGHGSFEGFARMVIRRRLASAVRTARRDKHRPLTQSLREVRDEDGETIPVLELVAGGRDPLDVVIARERVAAIVAAIDTLSALEREALRAHLDGAPVTSSKPHETRLDRARRKLRAAA